MGDDLGDDWGVDGVGSGGEEEPAAMAVTVSKRRKKADETKTRKNRKPGGDPAGGSTPSARKRGRAQLSAEGFEDDDSGEESSDDGGEGEDEEANGEARHAEDEAQRARAEKKKQKLKALKAKLKEKKRQRTAEAEGEAGSGDSSRQGKRRAKEASEQASELWARYLEVCGALVTPLERDSCWITPDSLARVDGFGAHTLPKLVGFIKASLPDWKSKIQSRNSNAPRGSPSVLIVCAGARRCVEVMKHLTAFRCQVVKLFAKHLKLEDQKAMLKKGRCPIAVGTPGRMRVLADAGALSLDTASLLVLDMEKNVKCRDVLTMDGVANDTMRFLAEHARPNLVISEAAAPRAKAGKGHAGHLRIALY